MEELSGVVERITYSNEANGFAVIKMKSKGFPELVTVVGTLATVHVGATVKTNGFWKVDTKFGRQFTAASFEETVPATLAGLEKYLGSGLIKGIGPKFAKLIVKTFKDKTIDILEEAPDSLIKVPGIGQIRVTTIKKAWVEQKEIKNLMIFLQEHDVSTHFAGKIFKAYGNNSISVVKENPFRLADDIWGIGFRTADTVAKKLGTDPLSHARCRSGILYVMNELAGEGHCFVTRPQLSKACEKLLELPEDVIVSALTRMAADRDIIVENMKKQAALRLNETERGYDAERERAAGALGTDKGHRPASHQNAVAALGTDKGHQPASHQNTAAVLGTDKGHRPPSSRQNDSGASVFVSEGGKSNWEKTEIPTDDVASNDAALWLPMFWFAETGVAMKINQILAGESPYQNADPNPILNKTAAEAGLVYDVVQEEAVRTAVKAKCTVLTGGPGTGKTTTTLAILRVFEALGAQVLLAAPTGRAAKRLSETTGREAKTLHRLLEYKMPQGCQRNADNPLQCDVLMVDETSMVDILLFYDLLKALPKEAVLLLVGDVDQLPAVGAGNVLLDMIQSNRCAVIRLTRIFRQASGSAIIRNAHRINRGEFPELKASKDSDFFFMEREDPEQIAQTIKDLCVKRLPEHYKVNPVTDIQVLCPMQRGETGAVKMNQLLQEALNPATQTVKYAGSVYKLGDKVMQIRNNYDKNIFNGDMGFLSEINKEDSTVTIRFDGVPVHYENSELDEIMLAYATTVHKAQGSEYPVVIAPFSMQHYMMLQRNLLYTCVTRAKRLLILVGMKKAIAMAIANNRIRKRNTRLAERLMRDLI